MRFFPAMNVPPPGEVKKPQPPVGYVRKSEGRIAGAQPQL
jgi:hypothetical protein